MKKVKTVDPNGTILVSKGEERYPYAGEVLMRYGFKILFLNMSFGLLPVTIWGSRIKYFKCSLSQLYTTVSLLSFIIFCLIFVRVIFFPQAQSSTSMTHMVILMAMGVTHVAGYIILLIRGHFLARRFPSVWSKLCKLLQLAVLGVYGRNCHLLKEARTFSRWAVWEFLWIVTSTGLVIVLVSQEYDDGMDETIACYHLNLIIPTSDKLWESSGKEIYQYICFNFAYFLWDICNSCHVLGTMLLCYIITIITICLKSVNQQLREALETVGGNSELSLGIQAPKIKFNWAKGLDNGHGRGNNGQGLAMFNCCEEVIIKRLETTRTIMLIIEDLILILGRLWGISLIVEVLVLIASGTTESYNFLEFFKQGSGFRTPDWDKWIGLGNAILVNFFFLFRCCKLVDRMQFEAKTTLHLLKQPSCQRLPEKIQGKVEALKQDLASTNLTLTASNYFQIGKFLLTSVFSQITTYVIVLLQFSQQDGKNGDQNNSMQTP